MFQQLPMQLISNNAKYANKLFCDDWTEMTTFEFGRYGDGRPCLPGEVLETIHHRMTPGG